MVKFWVLFFYCLFSLMSALTSFRNGFSTGNTSLSFEDNFAPQVKVFGRRGTLYVEPLNVHLPLTNYIDLKQNDTTELVISTSSRERSTWTIIFLNFISIISCAMFTLLVIDDYLNTWREQTHRAGMVNAMPSLNFTAVDDSTSASSTCAMCLEDYKVAEKLRVLPCHHMFHADCVDPRLISFRTTCPVCGDDALPEEVAIERIRTVITADLLNTNRLVNHYFLFHAGIFLCAAWDPLSKLLYSISWLPLILSLAASFRVAYAFPLIALNLQSMYDKMDTIQAINDRAARRIRILRFCLVICFISLAIGFAVVLPIALVTKTSPCAYFAICLAMVLGNYIMRL